MAEVTTPARLGGLLFALLALVAASACGDAPPSQPLPKRPISTKAGKAKKGGPDAASASADAAVAADTGPPSPSDWSKPLAPYSMDREVADGLKALSDKCGRVNAETCEVVQCAGEEMKAFDKMIRQRGRLASLESMAAALTNTDQRLVTVAAHRLGSYLFRQLDGPGRTNGSRMTVAAARRLLSAMAKLEGCRAVNVARPAVHAAMLTGQDEKLFEILEGHKAKGIREAAYEQLMLFGRLKGFTHVKRIVASSEPDVLRQAAMQALDMPTPTRDELAAICPWAAELLQSNDATIAAQAGRQMVRCRDSYIDQLIADARRRLDAGTLAAPFSEVLDDVCFRGFTGGEPPATETQCSALFGLLLDAAKSDKLTAETRAQAVWSIYHQRRDQETLDLLATFSDYPVREVRNKAREAMRLLVERDGLRGTLPKDPKDSMKLELLRCDLDKTISGPGGPLEGAAMAGDSLYLLVRGSVMRFTVSAKDRCRVSHDRSFGKDGAFALDSRITRVEPLPDGRALVATADGSGHRTARGGAPVSTCTGAGALFSTRDGRQTYGAVEGKPLSVVQFGKECTQTPMPMNHPFTRIGDVAFVGDAMLLGGSLQDPAPNGAKLIVASYDIMGNEVSRFGTPYQDEDGFRSIDAIEACEPGLCVFDRKSQAIQIWTPAGKFVTNIGLQAIPEFGKPAVVGLGILDGTAAVLPVNEEAGVGGRGAVRLLRGISLKTAKANVP